MKVMAVLFNTCLLYHVLVTSSVPSVQKVSVVIVVVLFFSSISIFCMVYYNAANLLCFDPVDGSFSPNDVSASELRSFLWNDYMVPIAVSFVLIIGLLIRIAFRLHDTLCLSKSSVLWLLLLFMNLLQFDI